MPRKITYTRDQILKKAFDLVDREGIEQLSIRRIAKDLNCSVAPIYVNFKDFNQLRSELIKVINIKALELAKEFKTGKPLKDIGSASIHFAIKHPKLFQDYIFGKYTFEENDEMNEFVIKSISEDNQLTSLSNKEVISYLDKIRIYQIGLSIIASSQSKNSYTEEELNNLLEEVSQDILFAMKNRKKE